MSQWDPQSLSDSIYFNHGLTEGGVMIFTRDDIILLFASAAAATAATATDEASWPAGSLRKSASGMKIMEKKSLLYYSTTSIEGSVRAYSG
jgi:hypothetical protein